MAKKKNEIKSLVPKINKTKLMAEIQKEINSEFADKIKSNIKTKMKEIRMTEILLKKQNDQLKKLLSGEKVYTEEELLFCD